MGFLDRFKSKNKSAGNKVVILGLDGVPYTLLKQLTADGTMPNLARIKEEGSLLQMDSSLPEISSVAWTEFMTGVNPAKSNIYGFMDLEPGSYRMIFPNSQSIRSKTLWEILGEQGKRSIVLNVPSTYPAKELQGVLVSGFVALKLDQATYPKSLIPKLQEFDYRLDVDSVKARENLDHLVNDIQTAFANRKKTITYLWETEEWDFFMAAITETDRLHHFMWNALDQKENTYHEFFIECYRMFDSFIGEIYERTQALPGKPTFMMMSDHGFTEIKTQVYLNTWLKDNGYLSFKTWPPKSYEEIAEGTRAFNMDPARIYINVKGKYPRGAVEPGKEYEEVREEIAQALSQLTIEGERIIQRVYKKEELYSGPYFDRAPDLVLLPVYGYDLKGAINKEALVENGLLTGMHTQDDAMFYINTRELVDKKPQIMDIAPTVLHAMGIPQDGLDGTLLVKSS